MKLEQLGRHLLVEYYNCDKDLLNTPAFIEEIMVNAAQEAKATVVQSVFHMFNPYGVSGAVIISESHMTIHTWPEFGYAAVDLFTCGDECDPYLAFDYLKAALKSDKSEIQEIKRGLTEKIEAFSPDGLKVTAFKAT